MKFYLRAANFILLTLMLSIVGCSALLPKPKFDLNDVNSSVVFGYIDTKDMPSEFEWAKIRGMEDDNDYVTASTKNGAFWHIAVKPGFRQISAFGGWNSSGMFAQSEASVYNFEPKEKNGTGINIKAPGVHFMGSHKFINHKDKDQFDLLRVKNPSEKTVLKMVLKALQDGGGEKYYSRQVSMIKKRIAELQ